MADNAASDLYDLMVKWAITPKLTSPLKHRTEDEDSWLEPHLEAVHLLERVLAHVAVLQDEHGTLLISESGALDRIARCVFLTADVAENPADARRHLSEADLTALQMLSLTWSRHMPLTQATGAGLIEVVNDARKLVHDADGLEPETRAYLLDLISALEKAVYSVPKDGDADVRRLASQLMGSLGAYLGGDGSPQVEEVQGLMKRGLTLIRQMTVDKGTGAFFAAVGSGAGAVAISALTDGK